MCGTETLFYGGPNQLLCIIVDISNSIVDIRIQIADINNSNCIAKAAKQ